MYRCVIQPGPANLDNEILEVLEWPEPRVPYFCKDYIKTVVCAAASDAYIAEDYVNFTLVEVEPGSEWFDNERGLVHGHMVLFGLCVYYEFDSEYELTVWRHAGEQPFIKKRGRQVYIMRLPHKDVDSVNINPWVHRQMLLDGWETIATFENGKYIE